MGGGGSFLIPVKQNVLIGVFFKWYPNDILNSGVVRGESKIFFSSRTCDVAPFDDRRNFNATIASLQVPFAKNSDQGWWI